MKFARRALHLAGYDRDLAEDLVQNVTVSWFELTSLEKNAERHMRRGVLRQIKNLKRPHRDALDRNPVSLDQIEEL